MAKRNYSEYISYKNRVLDHFYFKEDNSAPTISKELDIPEHIVYIILREEFDKREKKIKTPTFKLIQWKMKQKDKLIKALKAYNESVPEEQRVNI